MTLTEIPAQELADQHSDKSPNNLSSFLLDRCVLSGKRVRKNKAGATNSLSFRNLARLIIVTETEITEQRSPLSDGNPTADTPNFATFKLLLTGVDDSALVVNRVRAAEDQSRDAQLGLLDQLLQQYHDQLEELSKHPENLEDQLKRIEDSISQHTYQLNSTESEYRELTERRRQVRKKLEEGHDRRAEIGSLLERFSLLDRHYISDVARLRGIEEGGTMFEVLGTVACPLCGAAPVHQQRDAECDGNVEAVVAAAGSEIAKIELLRKELAETVQGLSHEAAGFDRRLPKVEAELAQIAGQIDRVVSPKLTKLRATYAEFVDKRGEGREALAVFRTIQDMERRRAGIEKTDDEQKDSAVSEGDLPTAIAEGFAQKVEAILKEWHFPEADRVYFDAKSRDLVIAGKLRTARGKGLRAITHAAFTVGLLEYCRSQSTPHPGFIIVDSPLLAYRAPEGTEEDLTGTDLNEKFYAHLAAMPDNRQIIIVENTDPPSSITARSQSIMFSKNPHSGRYGFFPVASEKSSSTQAS